MYNYILLFQFRVMMMSFDNSTESEDGNNTVIEQIPSRQSTPAPAADHEQSIE